MKKCFVSILLSMSFVAGYATTTLAENIDKVDFSEVDQTQEILNEDNDVTEETADFVSADLLEANVEVNQVETEESLERAIYNGWELGTDGYYYYYEKGEKAKGWRLIDGHYYYFSPYTGYMYSNKTAYIGGEDYRFNSNGTMVTGWYYNSKNANYEYYGSNGVMYEAQWLYDGYDWYYFDYFGDMVVGKQFIGGEYYKFNSSGTMMKNQWVYDSSVGNYEYYGNDGMRYESKWLLDGGKWYYLDYLGDMVTGEEYIGGKYYYFNTDGSQYIGWLYDRSCSHWLYYGSNGQYRSEWALIDGQWYHFNWSGCNV